MKAHPKRKKKTAPKAGLTRRDRPNPARPRKNAVTTRAAMVSRKVSNAVKTPTAAAATELRRSRLTEAAERSIAKAANSSPQTDLELPSWPGPLREEAFYGLAGEIVRTIEPHTESDPAALLLQFLTAFGNVIGRGPHFYGERDRHALNLFVVLVGTTSKGRKGTALGHVRSLIALPDPDWERDRIQSGLSSGEGLIHAVRDPLGGSDPGVADKRLFIVESEFASTLRVLARPGNTLSPIIRLAWDGGKLQVMTKNSPATATGSHISIVAHVTKNELRQELTHTDAGNGFANRFLWCCVRRSKSLPDGGQVLEADLHRLEEKLQEAVELVPCFGECELRRDAEGKHLWREIYDNLSEGKPGLLGAVTSRAEPQVMRLACVYALLDSTPVIKERHLQAALAVWEYCEASARFIFGDSLGDPVADEILRLLRSRPEGMTRTEINNAFRRNRSAASIGQALTVLAENALATAEKEETSGRAAERWCAHRT